MHITMSLRRHRTSYFILRSSSVAVVYFAKENVLVFKINAVIRKFLLSSSQKKKGIRVSILNTFDN